jgi:branched-chain amino acid aminotransferase
MTTPAASPAPFGTAFGPRISVARWTGQEWDGPTVEPTAPFSFHPATHALHYGSACFEGLKAHLGVDGRVRIFRAAAHVDRMRHSASILYLPEPPAAMLTEMIHEAVVANLDQVPAAPGSLYLRPTLLGTEPNIGAAASPSRTALLYVLTSPVGDYFSGGVRPLRLLVETERLRTTPQFGMVKSGANYAMALGPTLAAKQHFGVDQVLFAPGGEVQETGASNFMLIDGERVVTPALTDSFLHGVTRSSLLQLAADLGYRVEERTVTVQEVVEWAARPDGEAALSGTAAVLSPVGTLFHDGEELLVGSGEVGVHSLRLRKALTDIHGGISPDPYGWTTLVD